MSLLACWDRNVYAQSDTIMAHELASWMQEVDPYLRSVAYNSTYRDFKLEKEYLHCLDKLMADAPDIPLAVEVYICKALWLSYSNLVGTKAEAVRVVQMMPNWRPGIQKGRTVRVNYTMPITFGLQ